MGGGRALSGFGAGSVCRARCQRSGRALLWCGHGPPDPERAPGRAPTRLPLAPQLEPAPVQPPRAAVVAPHADQAVARAAPQRVAKAGAGGAVEGRRQQALDGRVVVAAARDSAALARPGLDLRGQPRRGSTPTPQRRATSHRCRRPAKPPAQERPGRSRPPTWKSAPPDTTYPPPGPSASAVTSPTCMGMPCAWGRRMRGASAHRHAAA
jgi:hypothetical protein